MMDIYIARLACGCIVSTCDIFNDETDALWLYQVRGNGWTVEIVPSDVPLELDCLTCLAGVVKPWKTQSMFSMKEAKGA